MTNYTKQQRGFTLIETMVGISILIVAITATFTAVQSGLSSAIESRDQVKAFFLAQEAVEAVRNMRDENGLLRTNWLTGYSASASDPCYFGKSCTFDAPTRTFTSCPSGQGSCQAIRQNTNAVSSTYGMYGYDATWTPTNFVREISLTNINANEILVTVRMTWTKGILTRSFVVKESILNWQ